MASTPSIVSVLFDLEAAIFQSHIYPLKSHLTMQSLCHLLQTRFALQETLQQSLDSMVQSLDQVVEAGNFLNVQQLSDLLAWVSSFRSAWVAQQGFEELVDYGALQTVQHCFTSSFSCSNDTDVNRFVGEFSGRVSQGFADFSVLSDVGYWSIGHAENSVLSNRQQSDAMAICVQLETGLSLTQLCDSLPNWHWQVSTEEGGQALSLSADSENYWVNWLHTMAAEREVWRHSASFLRFYKSLQEQVRERFSVALDQLYDLPCASNVWVTSAADKAQDITQFDLYGGRVYVLDSSGLAQQVLALSESVIPVYVLAFASKSLVVPVFRARLIDKDETSREEKVWRFEEGWSSKPPASKLAGQLIYVTTEAGEVCLEATSITRDYGTVMRSTCLTQGTRNIWRVRDAFMAEPLLPEEPDPAPQRQWRTDFQPPSSPKNHTPVYFQLSERHGMELFSDMVVGLQPYRALDFVEPGFIYHSGQVMPLLEPETAYCHSDDVVIFVRVRGYYFAFRGRYSLNKNELHKLVEGDAIVLTCQKDRINISLLDEGWFLLDQRHTYLFHKQLLEILK